MQISDFLQPDNVVLGLSAPTKERLLQALSARAAKSLGLAETTIFTALANREKLGSTGMGQGIAIPHATLDGIDGPFSLLVRLAKPIDFDAVDEAPVDVVFLLLSPLDNQADALSALSCAARTLRDADFMKYLRSTDDVAKIIDKIASKHF